MIIESPNYRIIELSYNYFYRCADAAFCDGVTLRFEVVIATLFYAVFSFEVNDIGALFGLFLAVVALASVALVIGYQTRYFAMALFAAILALAILLHNYWDMHGDARTEAFDLFSRDMLLMGALLLLVGMGAGRFAADNSGKKKGGH